jgi:hypothetical protein
LVGIILVSVLAFVGIFLGVTYPRPVVPGEVVILPAATPADEITALGYESHFTGMFVEDFMGAEVQDTIVVTVGTVITPTGTYQPISSAIDVSSCTLEAAGMLGRYTGVRNVTYTTGSLLWLINVSSTTITVTEGETADLTGTSVALGISDTLLLFFDSSDWIELSESDN